MVHEMPLKLYFMKRSERKISQCILPFMLISILGIFLFITSPFTRISFIFAASSSPVAYIEQSPNSLLREQLLSLIFLFPGNSFSFLLLKWFVVNQPVFCVSVFLIFQTPFNIDIDSSQLIPANWVKLAHHLV